MEFIITVDDIVALLATRTKTVFTDSVQLVVPVVSEQKEKTLYNSDVSAAKKNVSDLKIFGNGDTFKLICKASSQNEGWMKSTKACQVGDSCIVQVTTQQRNADGSYALADALTTVPNCKIVEDLDGEGKVVGRHLEPVKAASTRSTSKKKTAESK